jgi:hypothetical protein
MQLGKTQISFGLLLIASFNTRATLTTETLNNVPLVYSSVSNITWTADANLLGTLENQYALANGSDAGLITAIINANGGVIHDSPSALSSGSYALTAADFGANGQVDWWGAQAFVGYLSAQNYGGVSNWALPSTVDVVGSYGSNPNGSQYAQLFYQELGGTSGSYMPTGPFNNIMTPYVYWSGTEITPAPGPIAAWVFYPYAGSTGDLNKNQMHYAWAVTSGNPAAVPLPGAVWLFATALAGYFSFHRSHALRWNARRSCVFNK